jgi:hypothetical protein
LKDDVISQATERRDHILAAIGGGNALASHQNARLKSFNIGHPTDKNGSICNSFNAN